MDRSFFDSYRQQGLFFCACWMVSLVISAEFITSVSMIGLLVLALFERKQVEGKYRFALRGQLKERFVQLFGNKAWLAVLVPFLLVLVTAIYSSDVDYTLERLRIKLPFLVLPFAFFSLPAFRRRDYDGLFCLFLYLMFGSAIYVGINYGLNFTAINESISRGQPIPTPVNHIRYSLMLAFAILAGGSLWIQGFTWRYHWERYLIGAVVFFLFGFIHVLSVRSGLLVLYLCLFFLSVRYLLLAGRWLLTLIVFTGLSALPLLMYQTVPSFHQKINYMLYDLDMYRQGKIEGLSDSERITSLMIGLEIGHQHPLLGVGAGDLKTEVHKIYKERHPHMMVKMPHNQLVSIYAGTGLVGLLVFLIAFLWPLHHQKNYRDPIFTALHLMIFFSFLVENTIENSVGVAFYTLFLLLGMTYLEHSEN